MARAARTASSPLTGIKFRYAVVDLASAPGLGKIVMGRLSREAQPLFSPDLAFDILAAGPWLADLDRLPELEPAIDAEFRTVPWGYFVETSVDIVSLRRVFRRYNYVRVPDRREPVLFRYWDPRVMKGFLDVATREQREVLFEFIDRLEDPGGSFDAKRPR